MRITATGSGFPQASPAWQTLDATDRQVIVNVGAELGVTGPAFC
jgi:hypothetical protein